MRDTQSRLLGFLKDCERRAKSFTIEGAAAATGLSPVSVRTYISKKLKNRWVEATDDGHYLVRGIAGVSGPDFERAMAQNTVGPDNFAAWCQSLQELLEVGRANGYPVNQTVSDALRRLGGC